MYHFSAVQCQSVVQTLLMGYTPLACCHFPLAEAGGICFGGEGVLNNYCALPGLNKVQHADAFSVTPARGESGSLSPAERPQHPSSLWVGEEKNDFKTMNHSF